MSNAIIDLINYFQAEAEDLDNIFKRTDGFTNADAGTNREDALLDFLKHNIPTRTKIKKGGYLFDSNGNKSKQIDLMLLNDFTLQFSKSDDPTRKIFNCIEGCSAVITVKTNLNKNDLYDSIDNLASIPLEQKFNRTNHEDFNYDTLLSEVPQKIIFAYRGQSLEKTKKDLEEYFQDENLDKRQRFGLLIVNNEYAIGRISEGNVSPLTGETLKVGNYAAWSKKNTGSIGGISLFRLLVFIQMSGNFFKNVDFNIGEYYNQIIRMDPLRNGSD